MFCVLNALAEFINFCSVVLFHFMCFSINKYKSYICVSHCRERKTRDDFRRVVETQNALNIHTCAYVLGQQNAAALSLGTKQYECWVTQSLKNQFLKILFYYNDSVENHIIYLEYMMSQSFRFSVNGDPHM